jgi:hypothetical protein
MWDQPRKNLVKRDRNDMGEGSHNPAGVQEWADQMHSGRPATPDCRNINLLKAGRLEEELHRLRGKSPHIRRLGVVLPD